jgi:tRNA (guanosine-2'-O-)-methyltransferase
LGELSVTPVKRDAALVTRYGARQVIAWLGPMLGDERRALIERVVSDRRTDLTVLLDRFYDPHNNAAVLRSAEAFGLTSVHVVPGAQGAQFSSNVSQGVEKWIDHATHRATEAACDALAAQGYTLVGADASGVAPEALPPGKLCLVMGAEKPGLSPEARARCKAFVGISMRGMVESFNVSVAAALLLHELCKRPATHLSKEEKDVLFARFMVQSVQRAEVVLEELSRRA